LPLLINHTSNSKTVAIGITDPKAGVHSEQK
jgi:hypothetical protein